MTIPATNELRKGKTSVGRSPSIHLGTLITAINKTTTYPENGSSYNAKYFIDRAIDDIVKVIKIRSSNPDTSVNEIIYSGKDAKIKINYTKHLNLNKLIKPTNTHKNKLI